MCTREASEREGENARCMVGEAQGLCCGERWRQRGCRRGVMKLLLIVYHRMQCWVLMGYHKEVANGLRLRCDRNPLQMDGGHCGCGVAVTRCES